MKYDVAKLDGHMLDAAVAKAEGCAVRADGRWQSPIGWELPPKFAEDWRDGGPIIERERILLLPDSGSNWVAGYGIDAGWTVSGQMDGPTPLIAAMRAYVTAKFGHTVELP